MVLHPAEGADGSYHYLVWRDSADNTYHQLGWSDQGSLAAQVEGMPIWRASEYRHAAAHALTCAASSV